MKTIVHEPKAPTSSAPDYATILGYLGLLPFAFGAIVVWLSPPVFNPLLALRWIDWTLIYGAIILSFMAGGYWVTALTEGRAERLILAVIPPLVGWLLACPGIIGVYPGPFAQIAGLVFAFLGLFWLEVATDAWPTWYRSLRARLTGAVALLLLLMALGLVGY